jgi:hypothetical protein
VDVHFYFDCNAAVDQLADLTEKLLRSLSCLVVWSMLTYMRLAQRSCTATTQPRRGEKQYVCLTGYSYWWRKFRLLLAFVRPCSTIGS